MSDTANPATADTPQVLPEHDLKMHQLPTFLREYDEVARQCSDKSAASRLTCCAWRSLSCWTASDEPTSAAQRW